MGELGYNYTIHLFSKGCAVKKVYASKDKFCCVCREEIKTKMCYELDEEFCACFGRRPTYEELENCYCHKCVKKLTESVDRTSA